MKQDHFGADFGFLPRAHLSERPLTNVTELLWSDEVASVLRLCGADEKVLGSASSDYEKFCALAASLPLLEGHPLQADVSDVLKKIFAITTPLSMETSEEIWKKTADILFASDLSMPSAIQTLFDGETIRWMCDSLILPNDLPHGFEPILNGDLFLPSDNAKRWEEWKKDADATVETFSAVGCKSASLTLQDKDVFRAPSVYHIDQILRNPQADGGDGLWQAQMLRFLAEICRKRGWTLYLRLQCSVEYALALLKWMEQTVGLPKLIWSTSRVDVQNALFTYFEAPHGCEQSFALCTKDTPSEIEWRDALQVCAARYPLGRICVLTCTDLRRTRSEQARRAVLLS